MIIKHSKIFWAIGGSFSVIFLLETFIAGQGTELWHHMAMSTLLTAIYIRIGENQS